MQVKFLRRIFTLLAGLAGKLSGQLNLGVAFASINSSAQSNHSAAAG